jgi:transposase
VTPHRPDGTQTVEELVMQARTGADQMQRGRERRDDAVRALLALGMSTRQVAAEIGTVPFTGKPLVSASTVRRIAAEGDPQ